MLSYCLNSTKNTKNKNSKAARTKNGRIMHENVQGVILINRNLSKSQKPEASGL